MYTGEYETTREVLGEIYSTAGQILEVVIVIMVALIMSAMAVMYVIDQSNYMKSKNKEIKKLNKHVQSLQKSKTDAYRTNGETADVTDKFFGMYLDEKELADANEERFKQWDAKQVKRITALENQLRENGIEPIKWDDIKVTV